MRARASSAVAFGMLLAAATSAATADGARVYRLVRTFSWSNGFPSSYISSVEQDREGFLWLATPSGLVLFDGTRARVVSPEPFGLAKGGSEAGRVVAIDVAGRLFEATPRGLVPLDDPTPGGRSDNVSVVVASDGTPWRVREGVLESLGGHGDWTSQPLPLVPDDPLRQVHPGRDGQLFVSSRFGVWAIVAGETPRDLGRVDGVFQVIERADGSVVAAANQSPSPVTTRIFELGSGPPRVLFEEQGAQFISMTERGQTLWVAMDKALQALGPGGVPRERLAAPTVPATGRLVTDREGSLWMATPRGLVQIPEPDVWSASPTRGMTLRSMARTPRGVWGSFWGSLAFLKDRPGEPQLIEIAEPHYGILCPDGAGRVWTAVANGAMTLLDSEGVAKPVATGQTWDPLSCGEGAGGRRWIVGGGGVLWTVTPEDPAPHRVPLSLDVASSAAAASEDSAGTLWLAAGSRVCRAQAAEVASGADVAWTCEHLSGKREVVEFQPMPSGDVWALSSLPASFLRRAGGRWEPIPGALNLPSRWPTAITPSPSGGVWIVGFGMALRVTERADLPEGWEVVERLTASQGLTTINSVAIEEDADGTLWLGTDEGILRIPPKVRHRRADPPEVALVATSVDGVELNPSSSVRLPYRRNRLEARFAALTFREPAAVRYRTRLRRSDPWSTPSPDGRFQFVDLSPGAYELAVAASLDDVRWSERPALLAFRVLRPWYAEPWFVGVALVTLFGSGHLMYRLRVRRRLALERQRARIAMDLHDDVGSGLGTIAVLAGIAGRDDVTRDKRADVAARIAGVSQELAHALGDIVWSLRSSSGSLDALWNQLLDRARPLYASGRPRLVVDAPEPVPSAPLSLVVRRNLHLVALEALHNAARHSGASVVALRLERDGARWRLVVEDNGHGLDQPDDDGRLRRGLGLEAMKARAAEMAGSIAWETATGGGTRVVVTFATGDG